MFEPVSDQASASLNLNQDDFLTVEEFAALIGKTQQGVSYHLNSGKLKKYVDEGRLIFKEDRQYFIHNTLTKEFTPKRAKRSFSDLHQMDQLVTSLEQVQDAEYMEIEQEGESLHQQRGNVLNQVEQVVTRLLKSATDRFDGLHQEIRELAVENERHRVLCETGDTHTTRMNEEIFSLRAENKTLDAQNRSLEQEVSRLNQLVQSRESEFKTLKEQLEQVNNNWRQLVQDKDKLVATLTESIAKMPTNSVDDQQADKLIKLVQDSIDLNKQMAEKNKKKFGWF